VDPSVAERRCHNCGALVSAEASWCGQCYASLERGESAAQAAGSQDDVAPSSPTTEDRATATWPCPVCGTDNPLEADACTTCGTSFGSLLSLDGQREPIGPRDALAWSLVFPGVGHQRLGLGLDGLARGILFTMTFGMALLLGFGAARGPTFALFLLYLLLAIGTYSVTAWEAYRVAQGAPLFVPSRPLMWVTVVLMLVSVVALAITVAVSGSG
jgi:hypothetical protein